MKFKRGLLATDKDSSNCIKSTRKVIEGKEKVQIDEAAFQEDRALEQSIFISEQGSLRDETASTLQAVNNKACTANMTVHPEINDPVSAAVETKTEARTSRVAKETAVSVAQFWPTGRRERVFRRKMPKLVSGATWQNMVYLKRN